MKEQSNTLTVLESDAAILEEINHEEKPKRGEVRYTWGAWSRSPHEPCALCSSCEGVYWMLGMKAAPPPGWLALDHQPMTNALN